MARCKTTTSLRALTSRGKMLRELHTCISELHICKSTCIYAYQTCIYASQHAYMHMARLAYGYSSSQEYRSFWVKNCLDLNSSRLLWVVFAWSFDIEQHAVRSPRLEFGRSTCLLEIKPSEIRTRATPEAADSHSGLPTLKCVVRYASKLRRAFFYGSRPNTHFVRT